MMSIKDPAVSRDARFLMCKLSLLSFSIEKAIARETARGRPSGTETIRRAIEVFKLSSKVDTVSSETRDLPSPKRMLKSKKMLRVKKAMKATK